MYCTNRVSLPATIHWYNNLVNSFTHSIALVIRIVYIVGYSNFHQNNVFCSFPLCAIPCDRCVSPRHHTDITPSDLLIKWTGTAYIKSISILCHSKKKNSSCIANILDISMEPKPTYSPSLPLLKNSIFIFIVPLLLKLAHLAMLFNSWLVRTGSRVGQLKNK